MEKKSNYTLLDIAEWAEKKLVALPSVQRGFVWKPSQIENLWDSLLRGYPVGAFVLSPKKAPFGSFDMLDGQQRATAICLGFGRKTFRDSKEETKLFIKVFIDLEKPKGDDIRKYIFRTITNSHPWGYQRTDNTKALSSDNIRKAMNLYEVEDPLEVELSKVFPFDASLPVSFNLFINSALNNENVDELIQKIHSEPNWIKIKKQWEEEIEKITREKIDKPDSKKSLPELSTNEKINKRINEIFEAVKKMLHSETGQKIPALYLNFEQFKKELDNSPSIENNADNSSNTKDNAELIEEGEQSDEIENLFIRLNSSGTPLRGEDLNYSILKANIEPKLQEQIEKASLGLFKPSRFITIAYRLFQHQTKQESRDALSMRIKPKQFQKTINEKQKEFEKFLSDLLSQKKYCNMALLEYAKYLLEYEENNNKYGLPYLITFKIADVAPEVMFMLLYRIQIWEDTFDFETDLHKKMIGMITLFMWLGKGEKQRDHSKLLSNIWPAANSLNRELFWSSSTVQRAMLNEILTPFPSYDKKPYKRNLKQIGKYAVRKDQDVIKKFDSETNYGDFVKKMFYNRDLIIYAQREFLSTIFNKKQYHLDDTNVPFDWDHISPSKFVHNQRGVPQNFKNLYNSNGNFRAWPYSLNRMDQDDVPALKLDPLNKKYYSEDENKYSEAQKRWKQFMQKEKIITSIALKKKLVEWSFCEKQNWLNCDKWDMKKDWKSVYELILQRNLSICNDWYNELKIDDLIPVETKMESFSSKLYKHKWDMNPKDKQLRELFSYDIYNNWFRKPISIGKSKLYIFIMIKKEGDEALEEDEILFGIYEKDSGEFINSIKIQDKDKKEYDTDKESWVHGSFTLVSHEKDSYIRLLKEFYMWLKGFPKKEIKDLAEQFLNSLVVEYKRGVELAFKEHKK